MSIAAAPVRRHSEPLPRRRTMKVMMIVKGNQDSESGKAPDERMLSEMMKYNEELAKAGVLLELAGLQPTSKSAKIKFSGNNRTVVDGPFTEAKEVVAGFWIIQVKSFAEAIEWAKRIPNPTGDEGEVELRPFFEMEDFPQANDETLQRAAKIDEQIRRS
jgi:hypothetical protein